MSRWRFAFVAAVLMLAVTVAGAHMGPGRVAVDLLTIHEERVGYIEIWNTGKKLDADDDDAGSKFHIQIDFTDGEPWLIQQIKLYNSPDPVPVTNSGAPFFKEFSRIVTFDPPKPSHSIKLDLQDEIGFFWGTRPRIIFVALQVHLVQYDEDGHIINEKDAWAHAGDQAEYFGDSETGEAGLGWWFLYEVAHPKSGQFIVNAPVKGPSYFTPTHEGILGEPGGFKYFPGEYVDFKIDDFYLGTALGDDKVSPLDLYLSADINTPEVIGVARTLQTLDGDSNPGGGAIVIVPEVALCFANIAKTTLVTVTVTDEETGIETEVEVPFDYTLFGNEAAVDAVLNKVVLYPEDGGCNGRGDAELPQVPVSAAEAADNLEKGINASGIFRKNISKTEKFGESKQKLDVAQVYLPGRRSDGSPSLCCIDDPYTDTDECDAAFCDDPNTTELEPCGAPGVPYAEWRLNGDPLDRECDPRVDGETCVITMIECREVAKPIVVTYLGGVDIYDDQVTTEFWPGRFAWDAFTAISRDDGTTWKRMNVSRMADLSSFELETGEPFPGHTHSPYLKVNDNYILVAWNSTYCKSGNPRYSINTCDDPATEEIETRETGCAVYCRGNADEGTEVCEVDYPYDDDYYVTDIWGVRGQQQSVNYDEVDEVADLGIGEIPYSCLWAARGVIVTQRELDNGTFASLTIDDDPETPEDESAAVELGDIVWFKPERLTSGRRDAYISVVGSARGAGFAIAWQEDPEGLRPGKGKGPGQGWSGAISNHKTDIWYSFLTYEDFAVVDENFEPGGPGGGTDEEQTPDGEANYDDKPGLGRPKALVPFSLPVRISDNDMVNSDTLKVRPSNQCVTPPNGTESVCFPEVQGGSFVPLDEEEIAIQFCDHPGADPETCCDPDNHEGDPNCEDLKGLYGNLTGTKRYAYLAKSIDELDNATGLYNPDGDGKPDYEYYVNRGGTLDLCDLAGGNSYMASLPGAPGVHERWFGFTNASGASKLVCVTSDGRLLDGDVSASRPNIQMQGYTKTLPDGSKVKSAWVLLGYEESKGMGHSLAAEEHDADEIGDEIIGTGQPADPGQDKPIKQDLGKNVIYHSFDYTQPDLVSPGHIVNLPALCGGLYRAPNYCGEDYVGDNPTCDCAPGDLVPLYFDDLQCTDPNDPATCEWMPDDTKFMQYRTEIARRVRFIMQSPSKVGETNTLGAIIYKQGQEGQGRPADVFIRRLVKSGTGNPYDFSKIECTRYIDEGEPAFANLKACPNGAGDKPSDRGYMCNVWGESWGDRLCGGLFPAGSGEEAYSRRNHTNLTSADIDLAVDAGPDDTTDDPADDIYGTNKVLLWSQHERNLGDESFGRNNGETCDHLNGGTCPGMYSNARSHRGFIRGDFLVTAYAGSPNWAAARNGRDRYNFYIRKSFDGGQTWTTTPNDGEDFNGQGITYCPEYRTDPVTHDPPAVVAEEVLYGEFDDCVAWCDPRDTECRVNGHSIGAGQFEHAIKVSDFDNNKETSSDPRVGATPPTYPLDGRDASLPELRFVEDEYKDNVFFVAWGAGDNLKSIGGTTVTPEAPPTDIYYTRTDDYGDHFLKIPWVIGGENSQQGYGETVYRFDYLAKGDEEEQGECQLRATPDGSKMYAIYHELVPFPEVPEDPADPEETEPEITRWYPWEVESALLEDLFFRRVIFWPDQLHVLP